MCVKYFTPGPRLQIPPPHPEEYGDDECINDVQYDDCDGDDSDDDDYHLVDHSRGPGLHVAPEVHDQLVHREAVTVAAADREDTLRLLLVLGKGIN
jgi:hypothetical protein